MFIKSFAAVILISLLFKGLPAKPVDQHSYLQDLNIEHTNDKWICGDVECPKDTFGCKIRYKTDTDKKNYINMSYTCFDKDKEGIISAADSIEMSKSKVIDVEIESYDGAESVYSTGYGLGGNENAHGVLAVGDLKAFKESAARNKKTVDDSNS